MSFCKHLTEENLSVGSHSRRSTVRKPAKLLKLANLSNFINCKSCFSCPFHNTQSSPNESIRSLSLLLRSNTVEVINDDPTESKENLVENLISDIQSHLLCARESQSIRLREIVNHATSFRISGTNERHPYDAKLELKQTVQGSSREDIPGELDIKIDELIVVDDLVISNSSQVYQVKKVSLYQEIRDSPSYDGLVCVDDVNSGDTPSDDTDCEAETLRSGDILDRSGQLDLSPMELPEENSLFEPRFNVNHAGDAIEGSNLLQLDRLIQESINRTMSTLNLKYEPGVLKEYSGKNLSMGSNLDVCNSGEEQAKTTQQEWPENRTVPVRIPLEHERRPAPICSDPFLSNEFTDIESLRNTLLKIASGNLSTAQSFIVQSSVNKTSSVSISEQKSTETESISTVDPTLGHNTGSKSVEFQSDQPYCMPTVSKQTEVENLNSGSSTLLLPELELKKEESFHRPSSGIDLSATLPFQRSSQPSLSLNKNNIHDVSFTQTQLDASSVSHKGTKDMVRDDVLHSQNELCPLSSSDVSRKCRRKSKMSSRNSKHTVDREIDKSTDFWKSKKHVSSAKSSSKLTAMETEDIEFNVHTEDDGSQFQEHHNYDARPDFDDIMLQKSSSTPVKRKSFLETKQSKPAWKTKDTQFNLCSMDDGSQSIGHLSQDNYNVRPDFDDIMLEDSSSTSVKRKSFLETKQMKTESGSKKSKTGDLPTFDELLAEIVKQQLQTEPDKEYADLALEQQDSNEEEMSELFSVLADKLKVDESFVNVSPMLEIFVTNNVFRFYIPESASTMWTNVLPPKGTEMEKMLRKLTFEKFLRVLQMGSFKNFNEKSLTRKYVPTFLLFLWKLMGVSQSSMVRNQCHQTILTFLRKSQHKYLPSVQEILEILINAGISDNQCPLDKLYKKCENNLKNEYRPSTSASRKFTTKSTTESRKKVMINIKYIIETLVYAFTILGSGGIPSMALSQFVLLAAWLTCDKEISQSDILVPLINCLNNAINCICTSDWPEKLQYLTWKFILLGRGYQRVNHLAFKLARTSRGTQLRKAICFHTAQELLGEKAQFSLSPVTVQQVLEFLTHQDLVSLESGKLYRFLTLIEKSIGYNFNPSEYETVKALHAFLEKLKSKVKDDFYIENRPVLLSLLTELYSKLKVHIMSASKGKAMFGHSKMDTT